MTSPTKGIVTFLLILLAALYMFPIYLIVLNSLKTYNEIITTPLALPSQLHFENYTDAWNVMRYLEKIRNSLIITITPIPFIVFISAMAAHSLARSKTKLSGVLFFLFLSCMLIPFQVVMIPLIKLAADIHLNNSLLGLIVVYSAFGIPFAVFLYHGFVKTIPIELEEAAKVDGCRRFALFVRIIFPLLLPITAVLIILNVIGIWNDFFLPLLLIQKPSLQPLPLSIYNFIGKYVQDWPRQLPAVVLVGSPMIVFFIFMQRYIIAGISSGAVKG